MNEQPHNYYQLAPYERGLLLIAHGFTRSTHRTWHHPDGRAIGAGVMLALTDDAFLRFGKPSLSVISTGASAELILEI